MGLFQNILFKVSQSLKKYKHQNSCSLKDLKCFSDFPPRAVRVSCLQSVILTCNKPAGFIATADKNTLLLLMFQSHNDKRDKINKRAITAMKNKLA